MRDAPSLSVPNQLHTGHADTVQHGIGMGCDINIANLDTNNFTSNLLCVCTNHLLNATFATQRACVVGKDFGNWNHFSQSIWFSLFGSFNVLKIKHFEWYQIPVKKLKMMSTWGVAYRFMLPNMGNTKTYNFFPKKLKPDAIHAHSCCLCPFWHPPFPLSLLLATLDVKLTDDKAAMNEL